MQLLPILKRLDATVLNRSMRNISVGLLYLCTLEALFTTYDATVFAFFMPFLAPLSDRFRIFLNDFPRFLLVLLSFFFEDLVVIAASFFMLTTI